MHLMDIIVEEKLKFMSERMGSIDPNEDVFTILKSLIRIGMKFAYKNPSINKFSQSFIKDSGTLIYNKLLNLAT